MPPRKRARVSQATSPATSIPPKTPTPAAMSPSAEEEDVLNDPWTDEEEIGLFKGLMRWKPTGIHKHFHLLNLHQFLLEGGYIHPRNEHTKPKGIWRKLQTLYNLEALDEREDARQLDKVELSDASDEDEEDEEEQDAYSIAANKIGNDDFDLAGTEWEELKWASRLASEKQRRDESPPILPEVNMAEQPPMRFTPSISIEPSEVTTPRGRRGGPAARSKPTGRGGAATARTRKSARQSESVAPEEEETPAAEEEGGDEDEEDDEEEEQSRGSTPATRSTRNKGRPVAQPRGRGRGRAR